jgi:hypothetical protein
LRFSSNRISIPAVTALAEFLPVRLFVNDSDRSAAVRASTVPDSLGELIRVMLGAFLGLLM